MQNQAAHSSSSRKHFLQLKKLSSFPKEGGKKGIFVAMFSTITEIGHILFLKEMDHQHRGPHNSSWSPSLHPRTQCLKHSNILAKFPHKYFNSLRACLIPSVPHALYAIYIHWQGLWDDTTRCKFAGVWSSFGIARGKSGAAPGLGFAPWARGSSSSGQNGGSVTSRLTQQCLPDQEGKTLSCGGFWWDCWCRRLCAQINNNNKASVM